MDKALSNRERYINRFCRHLDKDINELGHEVKDIKNDAQVSSIYPYILMNVIVPDNRNLWSWTPPQTERVSYILLGNYSLS